MGVTKLERDLENRSDSTLNFNEYIIEKENSANKMVELIRTTFVILDKKIFQKPLYIIGLIIS